MEQALCHPHANHPAATTAPNVRRLFQIDSAVSRLLWIDIHDVGYCPFACKKDMNPDFHAHAQCDGCQNQGAMKVDDERFAFACQALAHTKRLDPNLKPNPGFAMIR